MKYLNLLFITLLFPSCAETETKREYLKISDEAAKSHEWYYSQGTPPRQERHNYITDCTEVTIGFECNLNSITNSFYIEIDSTSETAINRSWSIDVEYSKGLLIQDCKNLDISRVTDAKFEKIYNKVITTDANGELLITNKEGKQWQ